MSARSLINKFGKTLTFNKVSATSTYDPITATVVTAAPVPYKIKGYFYNYNTTEVNGTSIVVGDRKLMIAPFAVEPEVGDMVSGEGDKVSVVSVQKIMLGEKPEAFILQVRE